MKLMKMTSTMTMSSLEIAELTGKTHPNVLRDIRAMIESIGDSNLNPKQYQVFTLNVSASGGKRKSKPVSGLVAAVEAGSPCL